MTAPACVRATVGNDVVTAHWTDCLPFLRTLPDDSLHAIITDPPYGLANHSADTIAKTMVAWAAGDRERVPDGKGFMGRSWDTFVPPPAVWDEAMRVLRPGGHIAVFCGSRMVGPLDMSIRLAGFEMRDSIAAWLYGSGFPKSLDVGKAIDKAAGAEREVVGVHRRHGGGSASSGSMAGDLGTASELPLTAPATDAARAWSGWGTALKPAHEPILLARKPLAGTVAANTLAHGCGGLNVDACRVGSDDKLVRPSITRTDNEVLGKGLGAGVQDEPGGRWPTNVLLAHAPLLDPDTGEVVGDACADGCVPGCHVAALDEQSGATGRTGAQISRNGQSIGDGVILNGGGAAETRGHGDQGGASRFYPTFRYTAKAGKRERPQAWGAHPDCACEPSRPLDPETGALPPRWRAGTVCAHCERPATFRGHSTVKPQDLLQWLLDLLVAPGGYVADLFGGSGSFAQAVTERGDGTRAFVTERDEHSVRLIATRLGVPHDFRSAPLLGEQWVITSPAKATDVATTAESSNMSRSGNVITDESSPTVSTYTTVTSTSSTTTPTTSSSSTRSHTSDFTPDANCETECGGSHAESATSSSPSTLSTGISHRKAGRSTAAAVRVTSALSSRTNESDDSATTTTSREPDTSLTGRIAAAATTAELTRLHAELRGDPDCDLDQAELWALVEARWDEISAAARPTARRARTQRPRKPTWAS